MAGELQRREQRRWLEADDGRLTLLLGLINRLTAELERPKPVAAGDGEYATTEKMDNLIAEVEALIGQAQRLADREEDENAGIDRQMQLTTRVRPSHEMGQPLKAEKPARASSRVQSASADTAPVPTTVGDGWKIGTVRHFDQIALTGTIAFIGDGGSEEVPISVLAFRKSGLTNLFTSQRVECRIESRGGGCKEVTELKMAAAPRRMDAVGSNSHLAVSTNPHLMALERSRAVREKYVGW